MGSRLSGLPVWRCCGINFQICLGDCLGRFWENLTGGLRGGTVAGRAVVTDSSAGESQVKFNSCKKTNCADAAKPDL